MTQDAVSTPTVSQRRRARRLAVWNGALWAVGNGLASTTLVTYLAGELGVERLGLGIGLIVAAPHVVGLLRLGAPAMIGRMANRKRFCIVTFLLACLLLLALPWICAPGQLGSPGWSLAVLVVLWCLYHLMQYLGMVALWSWLADAAPVRIRGRFLGWRQRWTVAGTAAAAIDAGLFVWGTSRVSPDLPRWIPYGIAAAVGAGFMLAALVPLALMPRCERRRVRAVVGAAVALPPRGGSTTATPTYGNATAANWTTPFRDARFLRLLLFGCWFSFFNGITQSAQSYYPMHVLGVSLFLTLSLQTGMNLGQWGVSPWLGRLADRLGNRPVMFVCQLLVAAGMLFFAAATPAHWEWLIGAWVLWIAYAGLNVCLPNLMLKLAPPQANASYVAAFQAVTGLCYAANTILGGALVDRYKTWVFAIAPSCCLLFFPCLFVFGWLMRSVGAILLLWVIEPTTERHKE
jgi:MFS family permease